MQAGGVPLRNDDWQFEQDAIAEALKGIVSLIGDYGYLSGIDISLYYNNFNYTEGFVILNNEICYVPAGSVDNKTYKYIEIEETDAISGEVVLENGQNVFIHKIRRAKIISSDVILSTNSSRKDLYDLLNINIHTAIFSKFKFHKVEYLYTQEFFQGPGSLNIQPSNGVLVLGNTGNSAKVNAPNNSVLAHINDSFNDGTFFILNFIGNPDDYITIYNNYNNTGNIELSGSRDALFRCNSSVLIHKCLGKWRVLTEPEVFSS